MATSRSFNDMLNEYLAYDLLKNEHQKRNFVLNRVEMDTEWKGGTLIVPFRGGSASSFKYGGLTATNDVSEDTYVRGEVSSYKEIWGTMKWHARDLMEHGGSGGGDKVSEQSFLKNLPGTLERFIDDMKQVVSVNFLNGTHIAKATANGESDGEITVDHPERFQIKQKVTVDDDNSDAVTGYVRGIDMNTKKITIYDARTGGSVIDLTGYTTAQTAKIYTDGADTSSNAFTSIRSQLLSSTNGGDSTLFGQTKTSYPFLQATNYSGSSMTASNVLEVCFDFVNEHRKLGREGANELVMSYKNLANAMKGLELTSGPYRHVKTEANVYGWTTITVVGVKGEFKITGVQEMDDDVIYLMDWRGVKCHSNQGFKKHKDPNGNLYYTVRETTGYVYYVDLCFYGELVVNQPHLCAVMHSISY